MTPTRRSQLIRAQETATATTFTTVGGQSSIVFTTETAAPSTSVVTETQTVSATATTTETVEGPTATVYAQCQSNNIIDTANGGLALTGFSLTAYDSPSPYQFSQVNSALECCETCAKLATCSAFAVQYPTGATRYCYVVNPNAPNGVCSSTFAAGAYYTGTYFQPGQGYVMGQGACGKISNGGTPR